MSPRHLIDRGSADALGVPCVDATTAGDVAQRSRYAAAFAACRRADLRLWVAEGPAGNDALCSAAAAVDAMSGLWRAERHPVVRRRAQSRLSPW